MHCTILCHDRPQFFFVPKLILCLQVWSSFVPNIFKWHVVAREEEESFSTPVKQKHNNKRYSSSCTTQKRDPKPSWYVCFVCCIDRLLKDRVRLAWWNSWYEHQVQDEIHLRQMHPFSTRTMDGGQFGSSCQRRHGSVYQTPEMWFSQKFSASSFQVSFFLQLELIPSSISEYFFCHFRCETNYSYLDASLSLGDDDDGSVLAGVVVVGSAVLSFLLFSRLILIPEKTPVPWNLSVWPIPYAAKSMALWTMMERENARNVEMLWEMVLNSHMLYIFVELIGRTRHVFFVPLYFSKSPLEGEWRKVESRTSCWQMHGLIVVEQRQLSEKSKIMSPKRKRANTLVVMLVWREGEKALSLPRHSPKSHVPLTTYLSKKPRRELRGWFAWLSWCPEEMFVFESAFSWEDGYRKFLMRLWLLCLGDASSTWCESVNLKIFKIVTISNQVGEKSPRHSKKPRPSFKNDMEHRPPSSSKNEWGGWNETNHWLTVTWSSL